MTAPVPKPAPLTPAEVAALPPGSIVWPWVDGRIDGSPLTVLFDGALMQIALLPKRQGGGYPSGAPAAEYAQAFALVARGRGRMLTHATAQRIATAWWGR